MKSISVLEMLKIGVGPSSSHTLGPWRAAERWIAELKQANVFSQIQHLKIDLYGSLSLTGKGHATDTAVLLGLAGADPETFDTNQIEPLIQETRLSKKLDFNGERVVDFDFDQDIIFNKDFLPFHSNGITFRAFLLDGTEVNSTFYSIGGGFVVKEEDDPTADDPRVFKYVSHSAEGLLQHCAEQNKSISELVLENEIGLTSAETVDYEVNRVWNTMLECMYLGCHTEGILPGGLNVKRRAFKSHQKLMTVTDYNNPQEWLAAIRTNKIKFRQIFKWVSCFALAVNEVNAALGRVVTAPTNGSAGVIPAVLMYYLTIMNHKAGFKEIRQFLIVAGEIGSIFKKGATISAAMGGCQAEIGVSSAMAAAALCELLGGTPQQVTEAAEIAMEHHLGMTCDPIGGLVQIPCIERNAMGALKAINAAELALDTEDGDAKVSLDKVISTMWETAQNMNLKYKETSEGGLAVAVNIADC